MWSDSTSGAEALSARADARAAVPLQSRVRGLRQDRLSERSSTSACRSPMPCGDRRMRRARRGACGRRAAAAQGTAPDRRGRARQGKIRYRLHERAAAGEKIDLYKPHSCFNWSIHLDGDKEMHDRSVCQKGVYDRALEAIKAAKAKGFRVNINCTLFSDAEPERVAEFFDGVKALGIDGITISPGYAYERAPDQQHFLNRTKTKSSSAKFSNAGRVAAPGRSSSRRCSLISSPAIRPITARRGATRRARCSAGSGPAICSAKATRRPSRS